MILYQVIKVVKRYIKKVILLFFLLTTSISILLHFFEYPILSKLTAIFTPTLPTVILGSLLVLISLIIAVLQIGRQDSLGAFLYENTIKTAFSSIAKASRLARYQEITVSSKIPYLGKLFPDIEVLIENTLPPFGFQYEDIICFYKTRLFGIQNDYELDTRKILDHSLPKVHDLPQEFRKVSAKLLRAKLLYLQENFSDFRFFNGPVARVEQYKTFKDTLSERIKLAIEFRLSNYYTFVCTNETLEEYYNSGHPIKPKVSQSEINHITVHDLPKSRAEMIEVLKKHMKQGQPHFSPTSLLANNMVINLNIVTSDNKILFARRSGSVARKPSFYSSAVSGDIDPSRKFQASFLGGDIDSDGCPNPFLTACRESWEELNLKIDKEQVTFLAFCRVKKLNQPFLIGEAQMKSNFTELFSEAKLARDLYEREQILYFDLNEKPEKILLRLKQDSEHWGQPSALGILLSLIRRHGAQKILSIINTIKLETF